ncbi:carbohydrate ABC transporter permease [Granulosicoccus antarcticus]|uniref:L-arabinose transport system permease protein AraQ n=1 Tax=Granulosicoccus antarcticus IMCC3135 TaxID=1192854 RepID=A0A2Z2NX27_9GAMM|nr:carbohydrate ABC transporter permease [Granulosicoccus antarcticus]ASJ73420.1 L-arabinose transport system permease protein AraQ [Granulosicoccus antarcticus IMCC3135]
MAEVDTHIEFDPLSTGSLRRRITSKAIIYGLLVLFSIYYLAPLAILLMNSMRPLEDIVRTGFIDIPSSLSSQYWVEAWGTFCIGGTCEGVSRFFMNSLLMAVPATIISTVLGLINGYALSKWRFKGADILFGLITLGVFLPAQMTLLPWAFVLGSIGLSNTISGLVLIHTIQGLSFTTLFCRNYFLAVPDDLIKAARIDGAGFWRIFRRIILPLSPPIIIVTVIWQFTGIWNEFLFGTVFTSGANQPITSALVAFSGSGTGVRAYNVEAAAVIMSALPPLVIYVVGGKYFVRGLTQGAVK